MYRNPENCTRLRPRVLSNDLGISEIHDEVAVEQLVRGDARIRCWRYAGSRLTR